MYMEQDSTIVALRDLTKFIGTKQEASLPEETWKVLSQLLESNEKNTSVLSKSKRVSHCHLYIIIVLKSNNIEQNKFHCQLYPI